MVAGIPRYEVKRSYPKLKINKTEQDILNVHVGGNDIGRRPILDLMRVYEQTFEALFTLLPGVKVGGSQILRRTTWRHSTDLMPCLDRDSGSTATQKNIILKRGGFFVHQHITKEHLAHVRT